MIEVEAFGVFRPQKHGGGLMHVHPGEQAALEAAAKENARHASAHCDCGGAEVRSLFKSWPQKSGQAKP